MMKTETKIHNIQVLDKGVDLIESAIFEEMALECKNAGGEYSASQLKLEFIMANIQEIQNNLTIIEKTIKMAPEEFEQHVKSQDINPKAYSDKLKVSIISNKMENLLEGLADLHNKVSR